MEEEDTSNRRRLIIFGRDVSEIPCFRNSFLYGISGGFIGGMAYFLYTSKIKHACHTAMSSFSIITLSYWFYCRYEYSKKKLELDRMKAYLQKRVLREGTEMEKVNEAELVTVSQETTTE